MIYLDANATTKPLPEVAEAVSRCLRETWGNPNSVHRYGQRARAAVEDAREAVAALMGVDPKRLLFTSGGTEANAMALFGAAPQRRASPVVISAVEHPSVADAAAAYARIFGASVAVVPVDRYGRIRLEALESIVRGQPPRLVSLIAAHNETGAVQPVAEAAAIAHALGALLHLDATQWVGKIPAPLSDVTDLLSVSAHKWHGPKGVGALYVREGVEMEALFVGGGQERHRRAGTENVPAIAGAGAAATAVAGDVASWSVQASRWLGEFEKRLSAVLGDRLEVFTPPDGRLPQTLFFGVKGTEGAQVAAALDIEGFAVSTGSACSSGTTRAPRVLLEMGYTPQQARSAIRVSFDRLTQPGDLADFAEAITLVAGRAPQP